MNSPASSVATLRAPAMAGEFVVQFPAEEPDHDAAVRAFEVITELEAQLSVYLPESELAHLNENADHTPVRVEPLLFALLDRCAKWTRETDGAFDVTAGPLIRAWGFFERAGKIPSDEALAAALSKVGMQHVHLERKDRTATFTRPGVEINLGAVGKGYALDRMAVRLKSNGFRRLLLGASGSSTLAIGRPPWDDAWKVDIRHPLNRERPIALVSLMDAALSTSAASELWFEADGKRFGHILDPRTGRQPTSEVLQATAYAPDAATAEALSTAFFINGIAWTSQYCQRHPDIGGLLLERKGEAGDVVLTALGAIGPCLTFPEPLE